MTISSNLNPSKADCNSTQRALGIPFETEAEYFFKTETFKIKNSSEIL
jgi:hypothetical protein